MTLDELFGLILPLYQRRPIAIWFVDRPAEYYHLLKTVPHEHLNLLYFPLRVFGLTVHRFMNPATKDEYVRCPKFCREPGIWIEMSGGEHVRLLEEINESGPSSKSDRDGLAVEDSSRDNVDSSGTTT